MGRRRKLIDHHTHRSVVYQIEDDDDEEGLDEFEDDGFIVNDYEEDDAEEQNEVASTRTKKKRKRKSLKSIILDDDDFELLRENATIVHQPSKEITKFGKDSAEMGISSYLSNDEGLQFEYQSEEEENNTSGSGDEEDKMANFIVEDEDTVYENIVPISERDPKKKNNKRALGVPVSSFVLEGGNYLIGSVDELLKQQQTQAMAALKSDDMDDVHQSIQTEKCMQENDDTVIVIDVPERMQTYEEITEHGSIVQFSLEEESSWILNQLVTDMFPLFHEKKVTERIDEAPDLVKEINKEDIVRFLELHHMEKYDIPFIAMYRKEQCRSLLQNFEEDDGSHRMKWHKVLWAINELHRKWMLLQNRKSALLQYYYKHYEEDICNNHYKKMTTSIHQLFESVITSLKNAESERDVDDIDMKFSLHFPQVEVDVDNGAFKRLKRRSKYFYCMEAGLWKVAKMFGCDSEKFRLKVTLDKMGMDMEEPMEFPMEVALNFTCAMFETPEEVLKGARHMAALEISCEPRIRRHVHRVFLDNALVSTIPTVEGNKEINSSHQFAKVKWLHEKPLLKFADAQWLLIQKAEEMKLLQVSIKLPERALNELKTQFQNYYLRDGLIESGRLWNEQRILILEDALLNNLLPFMEVAAQNLMIARAKKWLIMKYGKQLWTRVSVAPYEHDKNNVEASDVETGLRVMACSWGPGKPQTTFVMLDSMGEVIDVLYAGYISSKSQNVIDQQRMKKDQHSLLEFLRNHRPHVVVLGAANWFSTRLKEDIIEIISHMDENPSDVGQSIGRIDIVYGDVILPQLYEQSKISSKQLPGKPDIVKQAVALGRYLQNPLAMVATLCGDEREILNWNLTSLDHLLSSDEKYGMIQQVMVDVTNQVGFDINRALNHEWLFAPLQYISGLGSQKASSIKKALIGARELNSRTEFTGYGLSTQNIFHNAVGFIRVNYNNLLADITDMNRLDDTRIHPESYYLAEELANAVHKNYILVDTDNDVFQGLAIENIKNNPNLVEGFDVNEYSDDYEKEKGENRKETFHHIKSELQHGFKDPRRAYKEPTQDEEFHMISGGYKFMLAEGRIVKATVRRVLPQRAICALESGLNGILSKDDFSDQGRDFDLTEKLHEGDSLTCKIKQIEKTKYMVFLTCKESEINSTNQNKDFHDADPYYCECWSSSVSLQDKPRDEKELAKRHFMPRSIFHHRFQNMTMNEAVEFLSDKTVGECLFRPSLRGVFYLTLSLKVYNGVYVHKDIIEDGKDQTDLTSLLGLGRSLKIGEDKFGDLDEVMGRYVKPLVTLLKAMIGYNKFKRGSKADIDDILRAEKVDYPMRTAYCFSISNEHPGTFILSYIRSTDPNHLYVGLHPKGFKFRKRLFDNIGQLVVNFQKYIDELQNSHLLPVKEPHPGVCSPRACHGYGRGSNNNAWGSQKTLGRDKPLTPFFQGNGGGYDGWAGSNFGGNAYARQSGGYGGGDIQRGRGDRGRGRGRERGRGRASFDNSGNRGRGRGRDLGRGNGRGRGYCGDKNTTAYWGSDFNGKCGDNGGNDNWGGGGRGTSRGDGGRGTGRGGGGRGTSRGGGGRGTSRGGCNEGGRGRGFGRNIRGGGGDRGGYGGGGRGGW